MLSVMCIVAILLIVEKVYNASDTDSWYLFVPTYFLINDLPLIFLGKRE